MEITEWRCIMNQCSGSVRALYVVGRKTQISVMGALERSHPGQVSCRRVSFFNYPFFSFTGQYLDNDGPWQEGHLYCCSAPMQQKEEGLHSYKTSLANSCCLKKLKLNNVRQTQYKTSQSWTDASPWANLPFPVTPCFMLSSPRPSSRAGTNTPERWSTFPRERKEIQFLPENKDKRRI